MKIGPTLKKLESLVTELESEKIDLTEAVDQYAEAAKLSVELVEKIQTLDKKITVIYENHREVFDLDL